jgi:hypothetical protein
MASLGGALAALAGLILAPPSARAEAPTLEPAEVRLEITAPRPGEVVRNRVTMAAVRGRAFSGSGERVDFDVMVVIDISHSTRYPSGIDVDGDGEVGMNPKQELVLPGAYPEDMVCSDAEDTILAAEVLAARQLLGILDSERTRVGIISFSGEVDPESGGVAHKLECGIEIEGSISIETQKAFITEDSTKHGQQVEVIEAGNF